MRAWEIWTYNPGYGDHPAVIISHPDRAANKPMVEFLLCSTQRANRPPNAGEILLDAADGLNWKTLCKCDLIYSADKRDLHTRRGALTEERRKLLVRTIVRSHGWSSP
jgi:mRNA-degrading endonuclease toxin of MazEF toxin-antitoxin module